MNLPRLFLTRAATAAALFFALAPAPTRASLDVNPADGIPDIWALRYSAGALSPTADTDGDGQKNSAEAAAGTNPSQPGSVIRITSVTADANGVHLTFPTEQGKRYQIQTATALIGPTWVDLGTPLAPDGSGTLTATNNAAGATSLFYRVRVQDIDSDGDGVSDWEEMQIGFDPYNSHSNGLSGADDLAAITGALGATNVVTVSSSGVPITEPAAGNVSTDTGTITITRTGNLNAITVNYAISGGATAGSDYLPLTGSVSLGLGVNSATVTVTPLPDSVLESAEAVIITASASAAYSVGSPKAAAVLITDRTAANGTGVTARFWNNTSTTIPVFTNTSGATNGSATPVLTRIDPQIDNTWGPASPGAGVNADYFVSRFTGDVLPEFSQVYTFEGQVERGGRLWVNGQLIFSSWSNTPTAGTFSGTIELQGGHRASLIFEHMARSGDATAILRWQSTNQPLQVIPQNRLFPNAPPQILSSLELLLLKGGPIANYQIVATNDPTSYGAANLPTGWTINGATGVISINPTQTGIWQIPITATNALGSGSAILEVKIIATDALITRDVWTGVAGNAVSDIPLTTTPTSTGTLTSLEGPQNAGDDYGARIRGYITAPSTGTYKFWLTADEAAELWISDDEEAVNAFKRAELTGPVGYRNWAAGTASPLLWLEAAKRYYVEVRHKEGAGSDHVSVGWLKPGDAGTLASEVVPGYALSQYVAANGQTSNGTLYFANLVPQGSVITTASGTTMLRLSADETTAILTINYSNLSSLYFGMHVHDDRIPNPPGGLANVICDIDQPGDAVKQPDGTYLWVISPRAGLSVADLVNGIKTGHTYFNVHSTTNPGGEIKGYYRVLDGSQTFTPPPPPPSWADDHTNRSAASRFLIQSTFGPSQSDLSVANTNSVLNLGYNGWIDYQASLPATHLYPDVYANRNQTNPQVGTYTGNLLFNSWWRNAVSAPDQLRQRVAFALSEILVTSEDGPLDDRADALSSYYDVLLDQSFGNFRNMIEAVTLHPAMGRYLDMLRNDKPDNTTGRIPNENYAREIKQLFSIGLNRLHPDGSLVLNSKGELIATYDQNAIIGFAHVFTGWDYGYTGGYRTTFGAGANWLAPMREVPARHYTGQKRLLNNVVVPGMPTFGGQPLDPYANHAANASLIADPTFQGLAQAELDAAHDALFNHPNCGPFICRQLIQRLVTSTPSRGYLYRVVSAFNNNGGGVRGDMLAVVKAILLDYEARSSGVLSQQGYGKQREPVARVTAVSRAFPAPAPIGATYSQAGSLVTVTTAAAHPYVNGDSVPLDFNDSTSGDAGSPADATYTITFVDSTHFTVRTKSFESVTYQQGGAITRLMASAGSNGFYPGVGETIHVEYLTGTPLPATGTDVIEYKTGNAENYDEIVLAAPTAKRGTYSQTASTITITVNAHGFLAGSNFHIDFITGSSGMPVSGIYPIVSVTTNTFTVTAADSVARTGTAIAIPEADVLPAVSGNANITRLGNFANRSGTMQVTYNDFQMDTTETDLNQTPMKSPTVFNFFLPDYQFPGILANAGLITPEFQLTSETSAMRQVNFLYGGLANNRSSLFSTSAASNTFGTLGLTSFRNGAQDIILDIRPWMGAGPGALPWAHNNNLFALIDELNTQIMAGQLPSSARTIIRNYVATLAYSASPTTTELRDRVRAVVHLIVTSPDFTIQK